MLIAHLNTTKLKVLCSCVLSEHLCVNLSCPSVLIIFSRLTNLGHLDFDCLL